MQYDRLKLMMNDEQINLIQQTKITIIGLGGVGGHAFEALVRFGIRNITVIDNDSFEESNLNRQLLALKSSLNKDKIEIAVNRAKDIDMKCNVIGIKAFLDASNVEEHICKCDYVIDACDTITTKLEVIKVCQKNNLKLISCLGTGNKLDPTKLKITTLNKTFNDPLAKNLRKLVKDNNLKDKINVVWSEELPIKNSNKPPGSNSLVPSVAGIYCASFVINDILKDRS